MNLVVFTLLGVIDYLTGFCLFAIHLGSVECFNDFLTLTSTVASRSCAFHSESIYFPGSTFFAMATERSLWSLRLTSACLILSPVVALNQQTGDRRHPLATASCSDYSSTSKSHLRPCLYEHAH